MFEQKEDGSNAAVLIRNHVPLRRQSFTDDLCDASSLLFSLSLDRQTTKNDTATTLPLVLPEQQSNVDISKILPPATSHSSNTNSLSLSSREKLRKKLLSSTKSVYEELCVSSSRQQKFSPASILARKCLSAQQQRARQTQTQMLEQRQELDGYEDMFSMFDWSRPSPSPSPTSSTDDKTLGDFRYRGRRLRRKRSHKSIPSRCVVYDEHGTKMNTF